MTELFVLVVTAIQPVVNFEEKLAELGFTARAIEEIAVDEEAGLCDLAFRITPKIEKKIPDKLFLDTIEEVILEVR